MDQRRRYRVRIWGGASAGSVLMQGLRLRGIPDQQPADGDRGVPAVNYQTCGVGRILQLPHRAVGPPSAAAGSHAVAGSVNTVRAGRADGLP